MSSLQAQIIAELRALPKIEPAAELRARIDFLKDYLLTTGLRGYVLGVSGGQDSTLGGWLAQQAVSELRAQDSGLNVRFVALRLPYGRQGDEEDAQLALKFIDADEVHTIEITGATDQIVDGFAANDVDLTDFNKGNVKARQRMIAHYAAAAHWGCAVLGSDHAAEAVTGFYTKFGDGAADVTPLVGLNKRQGRQLLIEAGCPSLLYDKVPTADLLDDLPGQSDEASLGVSYDEIDDYLEGRVVPAETAANIEGKFLSSRHKRKLPVAPQDTWWH